jgi:1-phosphatidylinositol-4-phosphate 5-kinase
VLGIIDPLTGFNFQKSIEFGVKRLRWGTTMSCVPPRQYADRFKSFMQQCFSKPAKTKK